MDAKLKEKESYVKIWCSTFTIGYTPSVSQ